MKKLALAAVGILAVTSFAGLSSSTASAGAACGSRAPSDKDGSSYPSSTGQWAMYNGSSTGCKIVSDIVTGDRLDYYCWTENLSSGNSWTYLRDAHSGAQGWVRDDHLPNGGSSVWCGF